MLGLQILLVPLGVWVVVVSIDDMIPLPRFGFKFLVRARISRLQKLIEVEVEITRLLILLDLIRRLRAHGVITSFLNIA